jgi:cytochrome bd-type quinol oxidase subunit 2
MIKKIKTTLISLMAAAALIVPFAVPASVYAADLTTSLCAGTGLTLTAEGNCVNEAAETKVNSTISLALNIFSAIVGIIAVVMIIVGGVKYITSQGESANITSAKNTILYALVGLVVVALAQVIVRFVLNRFIGNEIVN